MNLTNPETQLGNIWEVFCSLNSLGLVIKKKKEIIIIGVVGMITVSYIFIFVQHPIEQPIFYWQMLLPDTSRPAA